MDRDRVCLICQSPFRVYPYQVKKTDPKYCSSKCYGIAKHGHTPWNKGKAWNEEIKKKMSIARMGRRPANYSRVEIQCGFCKKKFLIPKYRILSALYCSKGCAFMGRRGKPSWNKGKKFLQITGEKHFNWKGDSVGYSGLHYWVSSRLGKPDTCSDCGRSGLKGKDINWANKSGEYKRELTDWIRLCQICHKKYDRNSYLKH